MKSEQKSIWDFVKELLHEQNCVIVPGFGGFVCNPENARIDQVSHLITPPAKRVVFNQNLKTNDGLLASRMSEQLKINYSEAVQMIEEIVAQIKDLLLQKKILVIEFFGSFRLNADANYVFLPDKLNNFLYSSFGLMPLQAEPVSSRSIKTVKTRIFKDRKPLRAIKSNKRRRNIIRIVTGSIVLLLAVNLFIFIKYPVLRIAGTTMNITMWFDSLFHSLPPQSVKVDTPKPASSEKEEIYIPPSPLSIEPATATIDSVNTQISDSSIPGSTETPPAFDLLAFAGHIAIAKANTIVPFIVQEPETVIVAEQPDNGKQTIEIKRPVKTALSDVNTDSSFYIIGGVFCKEKNAQRFLRQLEDKGFSPEIILNSRMNCNRVSYAKFSSRREAEKQLRMIHSDTNPEAWVFVQHN